LVGLWSDQAAWSVIAIAETAASHDVHRIKRVKLAIKQLSTPTLRADPAHARRFPTLQRDMVYGERVDFAMAMDGIDAILEQINEGRAVSAMNDHEFCGSSNHG
jgi:hypothetical protein